MPNAMRPCRMRGARVSMSVLSCPKSSWAVSAPLTLSARRAPTETRGLETALSLACVVCGAVCLEIGDVTCVVCVHRGLWGLAKVVYWFCMHDSFTRTRCRFEIKIKNKFKCTK